MDWWESGYVASGRTRAGCAKLRSAGGISVLTRQFGSTSDEGGSRRGQEKSLQGVISVLEHEDGIVDLERRAQLDAHNLDDVSLRQQEERLAIDHLGRRAGQRHSLQTWAGTPGDSQHQHNLSRSHRRAQRAGQGPPTALPHWPRESPAGSSCAQEQGRGAKALPGAIPGAHTTARLGFCAGPPQAQHRATTTCSGQAAIHSLLQGPAPRDTALVQLCLPEHP